MRYNNLAVFQIQFQILCTCFGYKTVAGSVESAPDSVSLAQGCSAVIPFVNDNLSAPVIEDLYRFGVKVIALRCAGYNNVDRNAAHGKMGCARSC